MRGEGRGERGGGRGERGEGRGLLYKKRSVMLVVSLL